MKKLNYLTFVFTILVLTISFNAPTYSIELKKPADLLKKKEGGGEKFDFKNANTNLVKTFYESSNNYLQAQEFLLIAYGKNTEAAQVKEAIAYAKDAGVDDAKKMKNSIKVLNQREKEILYSRRLNDNPTTLEDLSKKYKISRERVRQIENKAFEKLQKHMLLLAKSRNLLPAD